MVDELVKLNVSKKNIYVLKDRKTYDLGAFNVMPIDTYHDVENTSYLIDFKPYTMYYATDTRELPQLDCLKGLDLYCVENNYQNDIINHHIKQAQEENDENKLYYLQRTLRTHLSKSDCDSFLIENMKSNSSYVYLHISKYNNTENGDFDT